MAFGNKSYESESDDGFSDTRNSSPETNEESDDGNPTALLPKSFFAGKELEVGKQCKVEIQRVFDDQVEVSYVPHSDEGEGSEESEEGGAGEGYAGEMGGKDQMSEMMS